MKNITITIGREFGSGGKYIGEQVAKKLNIPFYNQEILNKTYEKHGCNYSKLLEYDEVKRNSLLKTLELLTINNYSESFSDDIYQELITKTIKEISQTESCVILGRNSNNILKDQKNSINIFIYSNDLDFKVKRKMDLENLTYDEALSKLKQVDKQRKKYYESLNKNHTWGNIRDYNYCLDSSVLGVDKTVDLIVDIYKQYQNKIN